MKKILTMVLVAMMLVTSLPVNMFAADYNYDQKAITSVQDLNKKTFDSGTGYGEACRENNKKSCHAKALHYACRL